MLLTTLLLSGCGNTDNLESHINEKYNQELYTEEMFASNLGFPIDNYTLDGFTESESIFATGLFDVTNSKILQSTNLLEKLSPASTTKIMTAYVALKYGNMDDLVTVSANAVDLPWDSQVCGLQEGDVISLYDLVVALTIYSGNDTAIAIAEHISGTESAYANLMTQEANALGATSTTFKNSHGLDQDGHQTTVYDLYLMFNEIIKDESYVDILSKTLYTTSVKDVTGNERQLEWAPTNYYHQGRVKAPYSYTVIGGKTGTTSFAKNCLVLLIENDNGNKYISVTMGSTTKDGLYENINEMIEMIPVE